MSSENRTDASAYPNIVNNLQELIDRKLKFSTVLADPPWRYSNTASRAAAANHYPTMSIEEICAEPVRKLIDQPAHLHLWTTNAFLRPAFDVMEAWGFECKSCLVWTKPSIGLGNYYRLSHEFLLLGTHGSLRFRRNDVPSWLLEPRAKKHSRKPFRFRELIERVSPGPYLELYGREEYPNCPWTVYGNQVERRLF